MNAVEIGYALAKQVPAMRHEVRLYTDCGELLLQGAASERVARWWSGCCTPGCASCSVRRVGAGGRAARSPGCVMEAGSRSGSTAEPSVVGRSVTRSSTPDPEV